MISSFIHVQQSASPSLPSRRMQLHANFLLVTCPLLRKLLAQRGLSGGCRRAAIPEAEMRRRLIEHLASLSNNGDGNDDGGETRHPEHHHHRHYDLEHHHHYHHRGHDQLHVHHYQHDDARHHQSMSRDQRSQHPLGASRNLQSPSSDETLMIDATEDATCGVYEPEPQYSQAPPSGDLTGHGQGVETGGKATDSFSSVGRGSSAAPDGFAAATVANFTATVNIGKTNANSCAPAAAAANAAAGTRCLACGTQLRQSALGGVSCNACGGSCCARCGTLACGKRGVGGGVGVSGVGGGGGGNGGGNGGGGGGGGGGG
eukprot:768143-Pleurochrysis_carterae.AAC.3